MAAPPSPRSTTMTTTITSRVRREAVVRAVDALLKWLRAQQPKHHHDDHLYLVLTLNKIPHRGRATDAVRISLRHPVASSVCLFVDDRPKSSISPSAARDRLRSVSFPVSVDVLSLAELRAHCPDDDGRGVLADAHDLFLADRRIVPLLPSLLGSRHFFNKKQMKKKSHKVPFPINLNRPSWTEQLWDVCCSTVLQFRSGTCSAVRVARTSQGRDEILDNVMAAIESVVGHVPKKWKNVKSFHLKTSESLALPIYQSVPELGTEIEKGSLKKKNDALEDDNHDEDGNNEDKEGEEESNDERLEKKSIENGLNKRKQRLSKSESGNTKRIKRKG